MNDSVRSKSTKLHVNVSAFLHIEQHGIINHYKRLAQATESESSFFMLSVIIITYNEMDNIERCLEAAKWADEIVIVDSSSADDTVKIAKRYTDKVFVTKTWPGFGKQKAKALSYATQEWVLSIDADEVISPELKAEILQVIQKTDHVGFRLPEKTIFSGQIVKYADAMTCHLRLFKRQSGQFDDAPVHENIIMNEGKIGRLSQPIYHYSFKDVAQLLSKMNQYSSILAEAAIAQGKTSSVFKASLHGLWMFLRVYLLRRGFLDGRIGLILSVARAAGSFYKHVKIAMASK